MQYITITFALVTPCVIRIHIPLREEMSQFRTIDVYRSICEQHQTALFQASRPPWRHEPKPRSARPAPYFQRRAATAFFIRTFRDKISAQAGIHGMVTARVSQPTRYVRVHKVLENLQPNEGTSMSESKRSSPRRPSTRLGSDQSSLVWHLWFGSS